MVDLSDLKQKAAATEALVKTWFFEHFHGSLVARSTEVWNAVHTAKEDLKRRLADLLARDLDISKD